MNEKFFVINIGRQLGSGGKQIGLKLAADFEINCYDKELLNRAAQESGLCMDRFEKSDEKKGLLGSFFGNLIPFVGAGDIYNNPISDEGLFRIQSQAIRHIAEEQSCIFIGRCADYILRDKQRCVNIFISAEMEDRIKRMVELHHIDRHTAIRMLETEDEKRASYYNFYSSNTWGVASTYHLCINSSIMGIDDTTEYIKTFIRKKLNL